MTFALAQQQNYATLSTIHPPGGGWELHDCTASCLETPQHIGLQSRRQGNYASLFCHLLSCEPVDSFAGSRR